MQENSSLYLLATNAEAALLAGDESLAERIATEMLAIDALSDRAYVVLGACAEEEGDYQKASACFMKAITASPQGWLACASHAGALFHLKHYTASEHFAKRASRLEPLNHDSYFIAASALTQQKKDGFVKTLIEKAVCSNPSISIGWTKLVDSVDETIVDIFEQKYCLLKRASRCDPNSQNYLVDLGNLLSKVNSNEAIAHYLSAIALDPVCSRAFVEGGLNCLLTADPSQARSWFIRATKIDRYLADAYFGLANVEAAEHQPSKALTLVSKALTLSPGDSRYLTNLGNARLQEKELSAAIVAYSRSKHIKPFLAETFGNLGIAYQEDENFTEAIDAHNRALCLNPSWVDGYWNKSIALLMSGDWHNGWRLYEWRWSRSTDPSILKRRFDAPLWLGEVPLTDKTILIHTEQGFGDSLQMARFVHEITKQARSVIIEAEQPLHRLFTNFGQKARVIVKGEPLPYFDFHCPMMSLPLATKTTTSNLPRLHPYISVPEEAKTLWAEKLGVQKKPRIVVMWRGGTNVNIPGRSISLRLFSSLLDENFEWISLQKDLPKDDLQALPSIHSLRHFDTDHQDFLDTAAICEHMDLVISIDTSVAHLAGALERPVWILLQKYADWRWLRNRNDTPWYPSATLFRQDVHGEWNSVLDQVRKELINYFN